ncbi:MAG: rod shape-determining protein MreD [Burkholderiales bacterium]|nr:rod shape-determining protein MreD [Burkholderiales bacterium]
MPAPREPEQYLLLPVNPWFIGFTLVLSLMLNLLPLPRDGWALAVPDWVALTLVFWNIHQPRRVGLTVAWLLGLVMDVNNASLLGEHALAYSLLSFGAITMHRRVLWFGMAGQVVHVLPLFLAAQAVIVAIRLVAGGAFPGLLYFASSLAATLLWPLVSFAYLAPQRRPVEKDENRPI